jgi:hypothetical protein
MDKPDLLEPIELTEAELDVVAGGAGATLEGGPPPEMITVQVGSPL